MPLHSSLGNRARLHLQRRKEGRKEGREGGNPVRPEVMYWIGYIYRYWHYYRKEESARIYRQADFMTMKRNYLMFHTMDPSLAVDDLIEMGRERS